MSCLASRPSSSLTTMSGAVLICVQHVSDHKTAYKRLAGVHFVDAVPKNASGKLLRRVLRQRAKEMLGRGQLEIVSKSKL